MTDNTPSWQAMPIETAPRGVRLRLYDVMAGGWVYGIWRKANWVWPVDHAGWYPLFCDREIFPSHWKPADPPPCEAGDDLPNVVGE